MRPSILVHLGFSGCMVLCSILGTAQVKCSQRYGDHPHSELRLEAFDATGAPIQTRVQLIGSDLTQCEGYTDRLGQIRFGEIPDGDYSVIVGPQGNESRHGPFTVAPDEIHYELVRLSSVEKKSSLSPISAQELRTPGKSRNAYTSGILALRKHDYQQAVKKLRRAIALYPRNASAYNALGVVWLLSGNRDAGIDALNKAVGLNDRFTEAYLNLAVETFNEKDYRKTDNYLQKVFSIDPLNTKALTLSAHAALVTGQFGNVIAKAREVHAGPRPHEAAIHLYCGQALEAQHLYAEAIDQYRMFISEAPADPAVSSVRSVILQLKGGVARMQTF